MFRLPSSSTNQATRFFAGAAVSWFMNGADSTSRTDMGAVCAWCSGSWYQQQRKARQQSGGETSGISVQA